jgi:hypothetical protein
MLLAMGAVSGGIGSHGDLLLSVAPIIAQYKKVAIKPLKAL